MEIVRKISVQDFQKLHIAVGWKILKDNEIEASLKNSMFVSCAVENGEAIAMARVVGDYATHGLLCDVIVSPTFQNRGIGKKIVQDVILQVQDFVDEKDEFLLELLPTKNNAEFYKKCGFKHNPESMDGLYKWFKNKNIYYGNCKKHTLNLDDRPFNSIKSGKKTIEMRLYDEKRKLIKPDDIIIFCNRQSGERIWCRVVKLHNFENFEQLYQCFNKIQLGYDENEPSDPKDMDIYYSRENQSKYGVVGIEIKLID